MSAITGTSASLLHCLYVRPSVSFGLLRLEGESLLFLATDDG